MHIVFTGGGTAGHVTPAIAMIEELLTTEKNVSADITITMLKKFSIQLV